MVLPLQKGLEIDIWKGLMIIIHLLLHTYTLPYGLKNHIFKTQFQKECV